MQYTILNKEFRSVAIIDKFESMLWTIRYQESGDFELYTPVTQELLDALQLGYYVMADSFYDEKEDTAHLMIVENLEISSDADSGNKLKVTGRSLKSIMERRIIWQQTAIDSSSNIHEAFKKLVMENVIAPSDSDRRIPDFVWIDEEGDWAAINADIQYEGTNLYECLSDLCDKYDVGYEVLYNFKMNRFQIHLIRPVDRSYEQTSNNPVIFSPGFENLRNSNYIESISSMRNVALVFGEGDEYNRVSVTVGEASGMERRELYVDASDLQQEKEDGTIYGSTTYKNMLTQRGQSELNKNAYIKTYEGEAETSRGYSYGRDFQIGDIVEIINEYGMSSAVRVSEVVLSESTTGFTVIPTFKAVQEETI